MRSVIFATLVCALLYSAAAQAQTTGPDSQCSERIELSSGFALSNARQSLLRTLTLLSAPEQSFLFRASSLPATACAANLPFLKSWRADTSHAAVSMLPVQASAVNNSAYPRSVNDGGAWQGVGLNLAASAGAHARWRYLAASLSPEFYYQQNRDFTFIRNTSVATSEYATPYRGDIDYPMRFGLKSFHKLMPGQSYLQANAGPIGFTLGTENLWIGAAEVYPILLSYTAPGFPHMRIGTQRAIDAGFARIEFQLLFASLEESAYFDHDTANDKHYFTTTMVVIEPKFLKGLYLGAARAYHDTAKATGQGPGFYVSHLIETPFGGIHSGNRIGNGLAVVLARWVLPESAFEAYAEWGREDTPGGFLDVLREPDWTQAYVLGFQKAYARPNRLTRFYGELNHLGESAPARGGRGFFSYYTHSVVRQGHTNEGQLLGAAIGPGSDAQLLGVDVFTARGRSAFRVERTRYDDDTYYRTFARRYGETRHDAELTLSASRLQFVKNIEIEAGIDVSRRYGRDFIPLGAFNQPDLVETNLRGRLLAAWRRRR